MTTTTSPLAAMAAPSYQGADPAPVTKAPPWIHTSTGRWPSSQAGVHTFSVRQSSSIGWSPVPRYWSSGPRICGAIGPVAVAERTPGHGAGSIGASNRSAPTGGAANGMPRNAQTEPTRSPATRPERVSTVTGPFTSATPVGSCRSTHGCDGTGARRPIATQAPETLVAAANYVPGSCRTSARSCRRPRGTASEARSSGPPARPCAGAGTGRSSSARSVRDSRAGRRFGRSARGSVICFPPTAIVNERYIHIGAGTMIGPNITLSAGMVPGQRMVTDPVVRIGDRCLIGKGSGIVGHLGDRDRRRRVDRSLRLHHRPEPRLRGHHAARSRGSPSPSGRSSIGDGSWLGHGTVVLPGARIGRHVVVGAGSVVTGELPDLCMRRRRARPPHPPLRRGRRLGQGLRAAAVRGPSPRSTHWHERSEQEPIEAERRAATQIRSQQRHPMSSGTMQLGMALVWANSSIRSVTGAPPCSWTLKGASTPARIRSACSRRLWR